MIDRCVGCGVLLMEDESKSLCSFSSSGRVVVVYLCTKCSLDSDVIMDCMRKNDLILEELDS